MQAELELGDDAEVAATAADGPVEVGLIGLAHSMNPAVGSDDLGRYDVVRRQPELPSEPSLTAAQRQAADAGETDVPGGGGQPVRRCGPIEVAEQRAALHPRAPALGIDAHRAP